MIDTKKLAKELVNTIYQDLPLSIPLLTTQYSNARLWTFAKMQAIPIAQFIQKQNFETELIWKQVEKDIQDL